MTTRRQLKSVRPGQDAPKTIFEEILTLYKQSDIEQPDRFLALFTPITSESPLKGLTVNDALTGLPDVIRLCNQLVESHPEAFVPQLVKVLEMCALPLELQVLGDDKKLDAAVVCVLDCVSTVFASPHDHVRITATNTIRRVIRHIREACYDDLNVPPPKLAEKRKSHYVNLPKGQFLRVLIDSLTQRSLSGQVSNLEELLGCKVLLECSHYKALCEVMMEAQVYKVLSTILMRSAWSDRRVVTCTEILWNILELCKEAAETMCQTNDVLLALRRQYELALVVGYKVRDKESRNDILMVLTLLASSPKNAPKFLENELTTLFITVACGAELSLEHELLKPFVLTMGEEDFQMKKMLWHLIYLLAHEEENLRLVLELQVLPVLLGYIDVTCTTSSVIRWPTLQLIDLQIQILGMLCHYCVAGQALFQEANGPTIVVSFLENCLELDPGLRAMALHVLADIVTTSNRTLIAQSNVLPTILHILTDPESNVEIKTDCLHIISDVVFRDAACQEQFRMHGGVQCLVPFLTYEVGIRTVAVEELVSATCDCVWNCIVGCEEAELEFLQYDGVFALLNVLDDTHDPKAQLPIMGTISDLLRGVEARKEFKQWRSKKDGRTAVQLMVKLWKYEGPSIVKPQCIGFESIGMPKTGMGSFSGVTTEPMYCTMIYGDTHHGLMPLPEEIHTLASHGSRRLKIFCILYQVGFDGHLELHPDEKKILMVIRLFADVCRDEVWHNIATAIETEKINMIPQDEIKVKEAIDQAQQRVSTLFASQDQLTKQQEQWIQDQETTFYKSLIKHTEKIKSTNAAGMSITEAKMKKAQMLKQSFKQALENKEKKPGNEDDEEENVDVVEVVAAKEDVMSLSSTAIPITQNPNDSVVTKAREEMGMSAPALATPPAILIQRNSAGSGVSPGTQYLTVNEYDIYNTLNMARTAPQMLLPRLELMHGHTEGTVLKLPDMVAGEYIAGGPAAFEETINYVKSATSTTNTRKPFIDVPFGMSLAAEDLLQEVLGKSKDGVLNHSAFEQSNVVDKLRRYGIPGAKVAVSLSLRRSTPLDVVTHLMVCDGMSEGNKQDRVNVMNPEHLYVGIASGQHTVHGYVALVVFCNDYTNKPKEEQQQVHSKYTM